MPGATEVRSQKIRSKERSLHFMIRKSPVVSEKAVCYNNEDNLL